MSYLTVGFFSVLFVGSVLLGLVLTDVFKEKVKEKNKNRKVKDREKLKEIEKFVRKI
jgi:hypothetical protein